MSTGSGTGTAATSPPGMTLQDIVDYERKSILDDFTLPYDWHDDQLVMYANEAYNIICRDAMAITDASTASVCNIATVAGTFDYALAASIIYVLSAKLLSEELITLDVAPTPAAWAAGATVTGVTSNKSCYIKAKLTSTTYTIQNRTGEFTAGEVLGDGANSADQGPNYPTVTDSSASPLMLQKSTAAEINRISNWRSGTNGKPIRYLLDYRSGYMTLWPAPDAVYTIKLTVIRYPIAAFTTTAMSSQTPEIPSQYHHALLDGIAWQAFLKRGENTYNPQRSAEYYRLFMGAISKMKIASNMYESNEATASPIRGFI